MIEGGSGSGPGLTGLWGVLWVGGVCGELELAMEGNM